jgi:hypothetical protein
MDRAAATLAAIHSSPPAPACVPLPLSGSWSSCPALVLPLPAALLLRALLRRLPPCAAEAACSLPLLAPFTRRGFSVAAASPVAPSSCAWHLHCHEPITPLVTVAEARNYAMQSNMYRSTYATCDLPPYVGAVHHVSKHSNAMGMAGSDTDSPRSATGPAHRVRSGRCPGR